MPDAKGAADICVHVCVCGGVIGCVRVLCLVVHRLSVHVCAVVCVSHVVPVSLVLLPFLPFPPLLSHNPVDFGPVEISICASYVHEISI